MAEIVTDPKLTEQPLAQPGKVIRRLRGSEAEHLAALGNAPAQGDAKSGKVRARTEEPRRGKPAPRPDRQALDRAEEALEEAQRGVDAVTANFRARERKLADERRQAECAASDTWRKAQADRDTAKRRYDAALAKWRA